MEITITIGDDVPPEAKIRLMNKIWTKAQEITNGNFEARHDGGAHLADLANAAYDHDVAEAQRWANVRWH